MTESAPPARRLTDASRRKLNELLSQGMTVQNAMQTVSAAPDAFEEVPSAPPKSPEPPPRRAWKGDTNDWADVVTKLRCLRALDRGQTAFGAERHHHEVAPVATEKNLVAFEKKLGVALPPGLRTFYATIGNGGTGPGYGLFALSALTRHKPAKPYPGIAALREIGARTKSQPVNPMHAVISPSRLTGLIAVVTHGCGIYAAVVCSGDVGRIVNFDEDGVSETDDTLVDTYTKWLDEEITRFELVQRLRDAGATHDEMVHAMTKLFPAKEAFRAKFEVDAKWRGLTPPTT